MKKEMMIFFGILVLIGVALYLVDSYGVFKQNGQKTSGNEIGVSGFLEILKKENDFGIAMWMEPEQEKNKWTIECAVGLSESLSMLGKNVKNYGFESGYCVNSDLANVSQGECLRELNNHYYFEIRYGPPSTRFNEKKAVIYVDQSFTGKCAISAANSSS